MSFSSLTCASENLFEKKRLHLFKRIFSVHVLFKPHLRLRELVLDRLHQARQVILRIVKHHVDGALEVVVAVDCKGTKVRMQVHVYVRWACVSV